MKEYLFEFNEYLLKGMGKVYVYPSGTMVLNYDKNTDSFENPKIIENYSHPLLKDIGLPNQEVFFFMEDDKSADITTRVRRIFYQAMCCLTVSHPENFLPYRYIDSIEFEEYRRKDLEIEPYIFKNILK